ncbi:Putative membrane-bound redox modulator Alx [Candidatus Hartigia pinicola]|nr:Putative membrane-bound redox modulator Alx [Candidatus Hartigia pinicola]
MVSTQIGFPTETVVIFIILAIGTIFIDLFMHRVDQPITLKNAIFWSISWIAVAMGFAGFLYIHHGLEVSSLFLTGYALEKILSIDNLFVMMAIFSWFSVPDKFRHRILYFGILGAIIFRAIFVSIGTGLLSLGPYVEIIFSFVVSWTALMMLKNSATDNQIEDYSQHIAYRLIKRFFPVWPKIRGHSFLLTQQEVNLELVKPENKDIAIDRTKKAILYATPLMLCISVVELSDVMFAFDSVPAIIAVSREPLIVYSAMMFAILGLRTLYFVLEALKQYLSYLEKAVIILLFFIAIKLFLNATDEIWKHSYNISASTSLLVVLSVLILGVIASIIFPEKK